MLTEIDNLIKAWREYVMSMLSQDTEIQISTFISINTLFAMIKSHKILFHSDMSASFKNRTNSERLERLLNILRTFSVDLK